MHTHTRTHLRTRTRARRNIHARTRKESDRENGRKLYRANHMFTDRRAESSFDLRCGAAHWATTPAPMAEVAAFLLLRWASMHPIPNA
ncbi:hypothetical protein EVAR_6068_1 [Eumeta japonica]|uniref:Uncharacterized protein n=1 Tax=Eumeta variegata TaxID=151549 RepID=A0A4C1TE03_EUMVA|nr:hypothetical protein EVAR_6068_1 [Eumeta japonica]